MLGVAAYRPPVGPTQMWFIAHTGTPGSEQVVSIDFEKCIITLPEQDDLLEPEFELLTMPLASDPLPLQVPPPAPPPSPILVVHSEPRVETAARPLAPPPSPIPMPVPMDLEISSSASSSGDSTRSDTPSTEYTYSGERRRIQHTLLTDGIICKWVDVHGSTWRSLARSLGGREMGWSDDTVRNRYIRILEAVGNTQYPRRKRKADFKKPETAVQSWTRDEDTLLTELVGNYRTRERGVPWQQISLEFGGKRTRQAIRNRASRLGLRDNHTV
jgi:hypothetical protein